MEKKLYRSKTDRMISGVCGGVAEYANIDPTIVRVIWGLLGLFTGAGLVAYIICLIVMPEKPETTDNTIVDAE